jgi:hypothetical protein
MVTNEIFSREFDSFSFIEIHRNPPRSLISVKKPSVKAPKSSIPFHFSGVIVGGFTLGGSILTKKQSETDGMDEELDDALKKREPNFYDYLIAYMNKKNIDDEVEFYKKAEVNRATFSKIRSMRKTNYRPGKSTVIKLCLALQLNTKETQEMLHTVGYGMSNSSLIDKIIIFFIEHSEFDIFRIDEKIYDKTSQRYLLEDLKY